MARRRAELEGGETAVERRQLVDGLSPLEAPSGDARREAVGLALGDGDADVLGAAGEDVRGAGEAGDEEVGGAVVDLGRAAICNRRPSRMMPMRSPSTTASAWSWVT
jgi:hypothetical protein